MDTRDVSSMTYMISVYFVLWSSLVFIATSAYDVESLMTSTSPATLTRPAFSG